MANIHWNPARLVDIIVCFPYLAVVLLINVKKRKNLSYEVIVLVNCPQDAKVLCYKYIHIYLFSYSHVSNDMN